jgi:pimeloyl-ACP methyl ester carboxylesterase
MLTTARVAHMVSALILIAVACDASEADRASLLGRLDYHGRVEQLEPLGHYSAIEAAVLLQLAGGGATINTEHGFSLYRVSYPADAVTPGTRTTVSGLIAIPDTHQIKGIVSWQHGTSSKRANSISKPSVPEGMGVAAVFAGDGYVLTAPDYIGLGVSTLPQAYYHWPSTVSAVFELVSIAEIMVDGITGEPAKDLFLAGFSQGAGASAATQRALEQENPTKLALRAVANISGAFDPLEISLQNFIERDDPFFIAFTLNSFAQIYGESLDGVIREPYNRELPGLFDGSRGQKEISEALPARLSQLVTERFMNAYRAGQKFPAWFYRGLADAQTVDYTPVAPMRIFYGRNDTVVIPEEAKAAFERMQSRGANVEIVDCGPYGHDEMVVRTLPAIQHWFDELPREAARD